MNRPEGLGHRDLWGCGRGEAQRLVPQPHQDVGSWMRSWDAEGRREVTGLSAGQWRGQIWVSEDRHEGLGKGVPMTTGLPAALPTWCRCGSGSASTGSP